MITGDAIYGMAEAGKLGWSSGTLPNLVEREVTGDAAHIKSWPLGKDASMTPTPARGPGSDASSTAQNMGGSDRAFSGDDGATRTHSRNHRGESDRGC